MSIVNETVATMTRAGREIERLHAELAIFMASNAGLTTDVLALRAINAELLAALELCRAVLRNKGRTSTHEAFRAVVAAIAKAKETT